MIFEVGIKKIIKPYKTTKNHKIFIRGYSSKVKVALKYTKQNKKQKAKLHKNTKIRRMQMDTDLYLLSVNLNIVGIFLYKKDTHGYMCWTGWGNFQAIGERRQYLGRVREADCPCSCPVCVETSENIELASK